MKNLLLAPKPLLAICATLLIFSLYVIIVNFKVTAIFRLALTLVLFYKVLSGSKGAKNLFATLLFLAGSFSLYFIYFLSSEAATDFMDLVSLVYNQYIHFAVVGFFCLFSCGYMFFSRSIKIFYANQPSA